MAVALDRGLGLRAAHAVGPRPRRQIGALAVGEAHHDAVVVDFGHGAAAVLRDARRGALFVDRHGFYPHRDGRGIGAALHAVVARAALGAHGDFLVEVLEDHFPAALRAAR